MEEYAKDFLKGTFRKRILSMDSVVNPTVRVKYREYQIFYILFYCMEHNYRHTNTTVSLINYHFVFCPRYRRKIFLIPNVEQRFKELVKLKCKELNIEIIAIECDKDHSHMFLNCLYLKYLHCFL